MNTQEWPLIIFSILAQMSVGAFVTLGIMHNFALRTTNEKEADRLSDRALLAIEVVMILALLASFFHLGNPLNAPRAISNVGSSWLSREILCGVLFGGLGFVFAFLQWRKIGSFSMRNVLAWVTAAVGLCLVFSMSQIYMLNTQPSWNTWATPVLFFTTAFLLGALAIGTALVVNYRYVKEKEPGCAETQCMLVQRSIRWIAVASVVLLGIELVVIPLQMTYLASSSIPQAIASVALTYNQFGTLFAMRLILVFLGAGVFAVFLYRNALSVDRQQAMSYFVFGAFALVLVAEVMGRYLFYATHLKIGL